MSDAKKVHNYCANLENLAMPFRGEQGIDDYVKERNLISLVCIHVRRLITLKEYHSNLYRSHCWSFIMIVVAQGNDF